MAITENPHIVDNPFDDNDTWVQIGSDGTILRVPEETAIKILGSRQTQTPPPLVPVRTNGPEGTTLLVKPERVASVQAQIKKASE